MSLTSVSSSSAGTTDDRCVEALVSVPFNTEAEAARRWGVKLYFGGDVDLCNRRVRSMEEELSWTVSPQQQQRPSPDEVDEQAVYKWMDFCEALPVIQSAEILDSVPSEQIGGSQPHHTSHPSRKLNASAYMTDLSTTHTVRSAAGPAAISRNQNNRRNSSPCNTGDSLVSPSHQCPQSPRTDLYRDLGFLSKPHRRRRNSGGSTISESRRSIPEQSQVAEENVSPERLMADLLRCLKYNRQMTSTSTFSDDLNTSSIIREARAAVDRTEGTVNSDCERYSAREELCPEHASAVNTYLMQSGINQQMYRKLMTEDRYAKDPTVASTAAMSDRHDRLRSKIKSLEEDLEEEREELRKKSIQHKEECQRLRAEIESCTRDLQEHQRVDMQRQAQREEEWAREAREYQSKLTASESKRHAELEAMREQLKAVQIELYETRDKLRLAEADLVVARGEVDRANVRMTELQANHEKKVLQQNRAHQEEIEKITSDCEHLALSLKKIKSAYDVLKKSKITIEEAEHLERRLEKIEHDNASKTDIIHKLEAEAEELRTIITDKDKKVAEAEICVNVKAKTLEEQNLYIESILSRSSDSQKECNDLKLTIDQLTIKLKTTMEQLEDIRSRHVPEESSREWLEMKQTVMLQKTELAAKNRTMETILKNLEELEIEKRREDERKSRDEARRLGEKDALIENLREQISLQKDHQSKLESQIQELEKSLKDRNLEYNKMASEMSDLKQTMKSNIQKVLNSFN